MKVAITGPPRSGKTTSASLMAASEGTELRHTDDLQNEMSFGESGDEVARWFDDMATGVIEGVAVPMALKRWLRSNQSGKPVDRIVWMPFSHDPPTKGQAALHEGMRTIMNEIRVDLENRGVEIEGFR